MKPAPSSRDCVVGVLALQGDFAAHEDALRARGLVTRQLRRAEQLEGCDALVLPGGESTTMWKLMQIEGIVEPLRAAITSGLPTLATCAGLILLASEVRSPDQESLGLLPLSVERNGYGRQVHSGVFALESVAGHEALAQADAILIRAPRIIGIDAELEVLARYRGDPALVRKDAILAAIFHPELDEAHPVYDLFVASILARHEKTELHAQRSK